MRYFSLPMKVYGSPFVKFLYIKEHKENAQQEDSTTIFVTNIAFDCTKEDLISIFSICGKVESVHLDSFKKSGPLLLKNKTKPRKKVPMGTHGTKQLVYLEEKKKLEEEGTKKEEKRPFENAGYAHVTFENKAALRMLFKQLSPDQFLEHTEKGSKRGVEQWLSEFEASMMIDQSQLQKEVDANMWEFDKSQFAFKQKIEDLSTVPDNDGWITVTRKGGKKSGAEKGPKMGATTVGPALLQQMKEKEKTKELDNFYRFQRTQRRASYMAGLRKRFEDDKKRIDKMKQNRKFRPNWEKWFVFNSNKDENCLFGVN